MSDPYAAPQSDIEISEGIIDALRGTRGWVLFIAILMVLGAVGMLCGGGFMALGGVAGAASGGAGGRFRATGPPAGWRLPWSASSSPARSS